ncbi:hypothetical protein IM660_06980 [Ruania alkalisoli]|uniref:Rhodanese domain-containing protein n=1 Tax=Ruania alkalisoli TaxID=2779775 RepID=A0A7M1SZ06_9MICO|nr:hypothetical protein [Ruania alkalisoli]QOR71982.1 hypothetical protein IM660_06980 [Ruania alkalisoli]
MAVTTGTTWDAVLSARPAPPEPGSAAISVRAAYQAALYERALLVDLRDQHANGEVPPDLAAAVLAPQELLGHLLNSTDPRPVILLSDDGQLAQETAEALAELELARVSYAVGGFLGWLRAGLPARN